MWQEPLNKLLEDKSVPYDVKIEVYYDTMNDNEQLSPDQALEKLKSEDRQADVISVPTGCQDMMIKEIFIMTTRHIQKWLGKNCWSRWMICWRPKRCEDQISAHRAGTDTVTG